MELTPIAYVHSPRTEIVDDNWDAVVSTVELEPRFGADALAGLDEFSHVEIVFVFDRRDPDAVVTGARHPRGNPDWPAVGIFAQRNSERPNRLGVTVCQLQSVSGRTLTVRGLDAINDTPVLDIKPYVQEYAPRGPVRQPAWVTQLMAAYW
jgi:tRNA (adenine37-N6)-methyltransferase